MMKNYESIALQSTEPTSTDAKSEIIRGIIRKLECGIEYPSGYSQLDYYVKGIEPGMFWVVGGYTSNGKTTFALNIAYNLANRSQPVTFYSTEMGKDQLMGRLATMISGINPAIKGSLTPDKNSQYVAGLEKASALPIDFVKSVELKEIHAHMCDSHSHLYIVDYLQMIEPYYTIDNVEERIGYVVRELARIARHMEVCVIATSQLRRGSGAAPDLSSFRGSGQIEEHADIAILTNYPYQRADLQTKADLEKEHKDDRINVLVAKNRAYGLTGAVRFKFDRVTTRLEELPGKSSGSQKGGD